MKEDGFWTNIYNVVVIAYSSVAFIDFGQRVEYDKNNNKEWT
jgi:serine/threonine-protein kinase RIO1